MKKASFGVIFLLLFLVISGCMPRSFVRVMEPSWASIELRENMAYDRAWQEVVDVLAKKFELEMISKEGSYVRTSWIYTWWKKGAITEKYRVRAIVKFSPDTKKVDIKTEANYLTQSGWITGTDTQLLEIVKTDIMGVIGRTTR